MLNSAYVPPKSSSWDKAIMLEYFMNTKLGDLAERTINKISENQPNMAQVIG